jgi:hypothetical protein
MEAFGVIAATSGCGLDDIDHRVRHFLGRWRKKIVMTMDDIVS